MIHYSEQTFSFRFKNIQVTFSIEQDAFGLGFFYWNGIFQLYFYRLLLEIRRL